MAADGRRTDILWGATMKPVRVLTAGVAAALAFAATAASAKVIEYKAVWTGLGGSNATAVGYFDIDTSVYPDVVPPPTLPPNPSIPQPDPAFQLLHLTVTGAFSGNGVFHESDFYGFNFWTPSALNLDTQLIGQPLTNGSTYGTSDINADGGDFNVFGISAGAPSAIFYFQMITDNGDGDLMQVTSIAP